MLCSESTGYCHSARTVSCCAWDGIFLPINNLSISCGCINRRNSVSNVQVWIWVVISGWYFRVFMEWWWALKGHWVTGRNLLADCHNSKDPFLAPYRVLEWIRRDSKIYLNFDTDAYCHRKLYRSSFFFHCNCSEFLKPKRIHPHASQCRSLPLYVLYIQRDWEAAFAQYLVSFV